MKTKKDKSSKRKVKSYRKQLRSEAFELESELVFSERDEAQIECKVGKIENIFSPYDIAKNRTISESFHSYLMQEIDIIPARYDLELKLHVAQDTEPEQEDKIRKAVKRHYSFMITSTNETLRRTFIVSFLLYFAGLISIIVNFLIENINPILPFRETLLIITWFLVWEGTSVAFFDRHKIKTKRYNMLRIYNARVVFVKDALPQSTPQQKNK
jgi:hypothetical protein